MTRTCDRTGCLAPALYLILIAAPPLQGACTEHLAEAIADFGEVLGKPIDPGTPWPEGLASVPVGGY